MNDFDSKYDPWIILALAIVYQATLDVHNGHPALANEAKLWLNNMGMNWCQILGVPESHLEDWSRNNFALLENLQRNWRY